MVFIIFNFLYAYLFANTSASHRIVSTKTTSIEDVSAGVLEKNEKYFRTKDKAKNDMM